MRWRIPFLVLSAALLCVSCDPAAPTGPDEDAANPEAPTFDYMNGPESPGPILVRGSGTGGWILMMNQSAPDPADWTVTMVGLGNLDPALSPLCTEGEFSYGQGQNHFGPPMTPFHAEFPEGTVHIYPFFHFWGAHGQWGDWCAAVQVDRIAQGIAHVDFASNQVVGFMEDPQGPGAMSTTTRARGTVVDLETGQKYRYRQMLRTVWRPGDPGPETLVDWLRMTPIGK